MAGGLLAEYRIRDDRLQNPDLRLTQAQEAPPLQAALGQGRTRAPAVSALRKPA